MTSPKKLSDSLRDNAAILSTALSLAGYGSIYVFWDDAREAFDEHPAALTCVIVLSLFLGYALCSSTTCAEDRRWERREGRRLAMEAEAERQRKLDSAERKRQNKLAKAKRKQRKRLERADAARRKRLEMLARVFMSMPPRRRAMVAKAIDEGEFRASPLDEDALTLCELGIFGVPPIQSRTGKTPYSIQPDVVREIREHRDEWLG